MNLAQLKEHPAFGSYAAIARVCNRSREAVRRWKRVPAKFCPAIEAHTKKITPDRVIRCEELRDDIDFIREPPVTGPVVRYCVRVKPSDS